MFKSGRGLNQVRRILRLTYRLDESAVVELLLRTGRAVITGVQTSEEIEQVTNAIVAVPASER